MSANLTAWLRDALRHTPARTLYNFYRHTGLPQNDVYLASYPKSGNTWLKMMLASIILDRDAGFDETEVLIPAIGQKRNIGGYLENSGFIVKTHERYRNAYQRAIYLVRDGRDVLVSYFHFYKRNGINCGTIDEFLGRHITQGVDVYGSWAEHVMSWVAASQRNPDVLIIRYEDMRASPQAELSKVCCHLCIDVDERQLATAIERNQIGRMRDKESESVTVQEGAVNNTPFSRSGKVGEWRSIFSAQQTQAFAACSSDALQALGYDVE